MLRPLTFDTFGTKTIYGRIDSLALPLHEALEASVRNGVEKTTSTLNAFSGGLPGGEQLLGGIDFEKISLKNTLSLYSKAKKDGKINGDFEKQLKASIETSGKDILVSLRARSAASWPARPPAWRVRSFGCPRPPESCGLQYESFSYV